MLAAHLLKDMVASGRRICSRSSGQQHTMMMSMTTTMRQRQRVAGVVAARASSRQSSSSSAAASSAAEPAVSTAGGAFASVDMAPADPILGVSEAFKRDVSDAKLNLGVGAYRTDELKPYVLSVVRKAEQRELERNENKEYLPIEGLAAFRSATAELLLGRDSEVIRDERIATVQGLSGTGSLRLGAALIAKYMAGTTVYIPQPTWGNHRNIFSDAGLEWKYYRYYDPATIDLDIDGLLSDLREAPAKSVVVLHGCAHNPTGCDPTPEQWEQIAAVCLERGHIPFFDVAYQGFASGDLIKDAAAPRLFAKKGMEMMVTQSYSKNLGLYAERIGALNVIVASKDVADKVLSQVKRIARAMYSNPPVHGARIVAEVVQNEDLFNEWNQEMGAMAGRIMEVRSELVKALQERMPERDWTFITRQIGMFSFTGLTEAQVGNMTGKHHVYMTKDGRISLAGLNLAKVGALADAIVDSVKNF